MPAVLTGNTRQTRDAQVPPPSLKENGDNYRWRMFFDNNSKIADSDTFSELITLLIPEYESLSEDKKFAIRFNYAKNVQVDLRAKILSNISTEQWAALSQEERLLLEWNDFSDPDADWGEDALGIWRSEVPLVLIDVFYRPLSENPPPMSIHGDYETVPNLIWLRPSTEEEFLRSLTSIGLITFGSPRAAPRTPAQLRR